MLLPYIFTLLSMDTIAAGCCNDGNIISEVCVTMPPPIFAKVTNVLVNGIKLNKYRSILATHDENREHHNHDETTLPILICFGSSSTSIGISFEAYERAAICTIQQCETSSCAIGAQTKQVLKWIYTAVSKNHGSEIDLLGFTAIAMHNMYCLTKFTAFNKNDCSIGKNCRGLLQLLDKPYYEELTQLSGGSINYVLNPNLLDCFSEKSINDEFKLYQKKFTQCCTTKADSMSKIIIRMAPFEAILLKPQNNRHISHYTDVDDQVLRKRLDRRVFIYNTLYSNLCNKKSSSC